MGLWSCSTPLCDFKSKTKPNGILSSNTTVLPAMGSLFPFIPWGWEILLCILHISRADALLRLSHTICKWPAELFIFGSECLQKWGSCMSYSIPNLLSTIRYACSQFLLLPDASHSAYGNLHISKHLRWHVKFC